MTAAVIRLDTRQPVDPADQVAFAGFAAQQSAALAADQAGPLLAVAAEIARIDALMAHASPALASEVRGHLARAGSLLLPVLADAGVHIAPRFV